MTSKPDKVDVGFIKNLYRWVFLNLLKSLDILLILLATPMHHQVRYLNLKKLIHKMQRG
jgi:hypothetical protein